MPAPAHDDHANGKSAKKSAKKDAAAASPATKAKPAAAAAPAAPKPYGKQMQAQQGAVKPAAKGKGPEKQAAPTAGPSQDDRGIQMPEKILTGELATRTLKYTIEGGGMVIYLAAGHNQGLFEGMPLELLSTKGRSLADIEVYGVSERLSKAFVKMTPDSLKEQDTNFLIRPR